MDQTVDMRVQNKLHILYKIHDKIKQQQKKATKKTRVAPDGDITLSQSAGREGWKGNTVTVFCLFFGT